MCDTLKVCENVLVEHLGGRGHLGPMVKAVNGYKPWCLLVSRNCVVRSEEWFSSEQEARAAVPRNAVEFSTEMGVTTYTVVSLDRRSGPDASRLEAPTDEAILAARRAAPAESPVARRRGRRTAWEIENRRPMPRPGVATVSTRYLSRLGGCGALSAVAAKPPGRPRSSPGRVWWCEQYGGRSAKACWIAELTLHGERTPSGGPRVVRRSAATQDEAEQRLDELRSEYASLIGGGTRQV